MVALSDAPSDVTFTSRRYLHTLLSGSANRGRTVPKSKPSDPVVLELFLEIGARIRDAREAKGWNRERLAQEMGVGFRSVQNYETGDVTLSRISQLAEVLDVDPRWLLRGDRELLERLEALPGLVAELVAESLREPPESDPASSSGL